MSICFVLCHCVYRNCQLHSLYDKRFCCMLKVKSGHSAFICHVLCLMKEKTIYARLQPDQMYSKKKSLKRFMLHISFNVNERRYSFCFFFVCNEIKWNFACFFFFNVNLATAILLAIISSMELVCMPFLGLE